MKRRWATSDLANRSFGCAIPGQTDLTPRLRFSIPEMKPRQVFFLEKNVSPPPCFQAAAAKVAWELWMLEEGGSNKSYCRQERDS